MKERIKDFVLELGVDDIGFASVPDYHSPRSPQVESIMPGAKSIIVLAYRELSSCESPNMRIAMNGRMDVMEFSKSCSYKLARFIEKEFNGRAMTVGVSYPMAMEQETGGSVGELSLRHAAVAAGLGVIGRHNLVIHPELGTRVIFTAVLCDLDLSTDPPVTAELCIDCDICVEACPAGALDEEGFTNVNKCLSQSQPWGIGGSIRFWSKFVDGTPEQQKQMFIDPHYWRLYQAQLIGFQYNCFKCMSSCPVGLKR